VRERLRKLAYIVASLGFLGRVPGARVWASSLGVAFVYAGRMLAFFPAWAFWTVSLSFLVSIFIVSSYVRSWIDEDRETHIVLDRIGGVSVTLSWLPQITIKYMVFGFIVYHLLLFVSLLGQRVYAYNRKTIIQKAALSTGEIILLSLLTNGGLRVLWWVTH